MMTKFTKSMAAFGLAAAIAAPAMAANVNETFAYADGELEAVSNGAWVYESSFPSSYGNKLSVAGGKMNTSSNYYGGAGYNLADTADFVNGKITANFTVDQLFGGGGEIAISARNQDDNSRIQLSLVAVEVDPGGQYAGEKGWYNFSLYAYGTELPGQWCNTMARANDVYSGKAFSLFLELDGENVTAGFTMDKSGDFGATWTKAEHVFNTTTAITGAGEAGLFTRNWGAPTAIHFNALVDDYTVEYAAIPEPASLALLGLGGLAMLRRRK